MAGRSRRSAVAACGMALIGGLAWVCAQPPLPGLGFNERQVEKRTSPEDRPDIWMLDFYFKDPRVIKVDIPGRGPKLVWYLWYQVANGTGAPRTFIPDFVWVTHDENTVHHDQLLPKAQAAIAKIEDPNNIFPLRNSVTISQEPIPVSKEFDDNGQRIAFPKLITGVATWVVGDRNASEADKAKYPDDVNPKSTQFSIFVYGLSDGWSMIEDQNGKPIVKQKTLQLKFKRLGDEYTATSSQIRYVGHEWIYATVDRKLPVLGDDKPKVNAPASGQSPAKP